MTTFSDFQLNPAILKALGEEGYTEPTPIQAQAIPSVLLGKDLLGIAQTGTGKTAAFALPILHRLVAEKREPLRRGCRVLVLSPTRELASQIAESFRTYGRHLGIRVAIVFGGVGHRPQRDALARGVDVLVATPGRLLDHMDERDIVLDGVEMFVLDEADQMLDMGFIQPIRRIVSKLSARRQSLFFSATMPQEIGRLAGELLKDPVKVAVTPSATTVQRVSQHVYFVESKAKPALLVELLANPELARTLVFTRTKRGADRVARHLEGAGIKVSAIHGNKSQNQREAALDAFKASKIRALVATDVAARGIDVDLVTHVVNYELPNIPESYVHRIGRTARAGADGIAISLCDADERDYLRDIERVTRQSIPATDRRRDTTLAISAEPAERERPRGHAGKQQRKPQRSAAQRHARSGTGSSNGGQHRPAQNEGRDRPRTDHRGGQQRPAQHEGRDRPRADHRSGQQRPAQNEGRDRPRADHRDGQHRPAQHEGRDRPHAPAARPVQHNGERRPAPGGSGLAGVAFLASPGRSSSPRNTDDRRNGGHNGGDRNRHPHAHRSNERAAGGQRDQRQPSGRVHRGR